MKTDKKRNRRRNILSNPKAQIRIVAFFALLASVYAATNYYIAMKALNTLAGEVLSLPLSNSLRYDVGVMLNNQAEVLNLQLALFTFLTIFMLSLGGVLLSHRIGGPIYRIREHLKGLTDGSMQPHYVHFRKGDFFHDLADAFNKYQEKQGHLQAGTD